MNYAALEAARTGQPLLYGFNPDPSIVRDGSWYYMVTSTFTYLPGLPVYRSQDLIAWELAGFVIDRPGQVDLSGLAPDRGVFAPTIRVHDGRWYCIVTIVAGGGTALFTADDPAGPWSEPVWMNQVEGIDPSLFFDDDGRVWLCGTRPAPEGERYYGNWEIWLAEADPKTWQFKGEPKGIWRGALRDVVWPEGPHIYKRGSWYYLLIAEGGTDRFHAVTIARSETLDGPWLGNPRNPILTHRHLGEEYKIQNVGHGEIIDSPDGQSWLIVHGNRKVPLSGVRDPIIIETGSHRFGSPLGREPFICPVIWEHEWPVCAPGEGRIGSRNHASHTASGQVYFEDFSEPAELVARGWVSLNRFPEFEKGSPVGGGLLLPLCNGSGGTQAGSASANTNGIRGDAGLENTSGRGAGAGAGFIAKRVPSFSVRYHIEAVFGGEDGSAPFGICISLAPDNEYRVEVRQARGSGHIKLVEVRSGKETELQRTALGARAGDRVWLQAEVTPGGLRFAFLGEGPGAPPKDIEASARALHVLGAEWVALGSNLPFDILSPEVSGGFTGSVFGLWAAGQAHSDGAAPAGRTRFMWFSELPGE